MNTAIVKPLLSSVEGLPSIIETPGYDPENHGTGIVHLGLGAFHRAHQAAYTDTAIATSGGDWKIIGVSMRDVKIPENVNAQNGLYTLITKHAAGNNARVIASIEHALSAATEPASVLNQMSLPHTRIVSLTITEKGYGIDRSHGGIDVSNPVIKHDLQNPGTPQSAIGFIVQALKNRSEKEIPPFTVLCCDNLPNNGQFVRRGVLDFAKMAYPNWAQWIEQHVLFPSTMVDRITPASTPETLSLARQLTGRYDNIAVESEPFHQWVIEDQFSMGRPDWDTAGAVFTDDVAPFEEMKIRMLNGSHSMLAYAGFLAGHTYVREAMNDHSIATLVLRHMQAAAQTLVPIPQVEFETYAEDLVERFSNPNIAHEVYQIATDGSQKLPQRIFQPAVESLRYHYNIRPFAFATALWMLYCRGESDSAGIYTVNDPIAPDIKAAATHEHVSEIIESFYQLPGLIPKELACNNTWTVELQSILTTLLHKGIRVALDVEAGMSV